MKITLISKLDFFCILKTVTCNITNQFGQSIACHKTTGTKDGFFFKTWMLALLQNKTVSRTIHKSEKSNNILRYLIL